MVTDEGGVWVSYYSDGSGFYVHPSELQAYRDSAGTGRDVIFLPYNTHVSDAVAQQRADQP